MATYIKPKNPYDINNMGTLPPPPGHPIGQFDPSPDKERIFTAVGIALAVVTFLVIAGRIYLNASDRGRRLAWDDAFVVLGWICATITVAIWISIRRFFRRGWNIPLSWFGPGFFKPLVCAQVLLAFSQIFTKCAFIFLYFRIFSPSKPVRYSLYIIFVVAVCYPFATIGVVSAYCTPPPGKAWTVWNVPGCNKATFLAPIIGSINVAVDIALFIIPLFVISTLKLSRARKWSLLAIFMTGFLAVVGAVIGLAYRIVAYKYGKGGKDVNYYNFYMSLWAQVEVNFCQIASSMPAYATFSKVHIFSRFRRFRERLSSGLRSSDNEKDPSKTKIPHVDTNAPQLNTLHFGTQATTHYTERGNIEYTHGTQTGGGDMSTVGMSMVGGGKGNESATLLSVVPKGDGGGKETVRSKWGRARAKGFEHDETAVETIQHV